MPAQRPANPWVGYLAQPPSTSCERCGGSDYYRHRLTPRLTMWICGSCTPVVAPEEAQAARSWLLDPMTDDGKNQDPMPAEEEEDDRWTPEELTAGRYWLEHNRRIEAKNERGRDV